MKRLAVRLAATAAACLLAWLAYEAVQRYAGGPVVGDIKPLLGLGAVFLVLGIAENLHRRLKPPRTPSAPGAAATSKGS